MKTAPLIYALFLLLPACLNAQADDQFSFVDSERYVYVNRWVSPVFGDFVTVTQDHASDAQMTSWGYTKKTYQYSGWLYKPAPNAVAVYRWTMPNCKEFIVLAEHEHTDAQLSDWGYTDKTFMFYAYKTRLNDDFAAVNRWVNALPNGNPCRDFTLSVLESEFTDEQLTAWGYRDKKTQFYVLKP
jgi:hypothetical protein